MERLDKRLIMIRIKTNKNLFKMGRLSISK